MLLKKAAGVSDVSAALGLSHGVIYTYAECKERCCTWLCFA
ncbi:hypothetical protein [Amycolatopsis sp. FDAARGOS 1241]|nr:hypothetical protein [Amycolatopsis sp. FDAARGOS 1241]